MTPPHTVPGFLASAGWAGAQVLPLAGDASFRRYFRVLDGHRRAVLMDAPPAHENSRPFLHISGYLREHGFRAPAPIAIDLDAGLILLEDFGDTLMREAVDADPAIESRVYTSAVSLLAELHQKIPADIAPYDEHTYLREAGLFTEWYLPALGIDCDTGSFDAAWREALAPMISSTRKPVTVLRDFHAENLMLLESGDLGLLDFQDALLGHPAYDLVSLLQDARRDVSPALEAQMIDHYCDTVQTDDTQAFRAAYAVLGAQRNAKIIGIFTRLWKRDGKPRYLSLIPRVWGLLERDLAHPALAPVARWMDANLPADRHQLPDFDASQR